MDRERQVRYNCRTSKDNLNSLRWWFLIICDERAIERVQTKIYDFFAPVFEQAKDIEGKVKGTDLMYKLIAFDSKKRATFHDLKNVYRRVLIDRNLYDRVQPDGLTNFVVGDLES